MAPVYAQINSSPILTEGAYQELTEGYPLPPRETILSIQSLYAQTLSLHRALGLEIDETPTSDGKGQLKYLRMGLVREWVKFELAFDDWVQAQMKLATTNSLSPESGAARGKMEKALDDLEVQMSRLTKEIKKLKKKLR